MVIEAAEAIANEQTANYEDILYFMKDSVGDLSAQTHDWQVEAWIATAAYGFRVKRMGISDKKDLRVAMDNFYEGYKTAIYL